MGAKPSVTTHVHARHRGTHRAGARRTYGGRRAQSADGRVQQQPDGSEGKPEARSQRRHPYQSNTATDARSHTMPAVPGRPHHRPHAAMAGVAKVRTAGTSAPASNT